MSGVRTFLVGISAIFAIQGCGKVSEDDARKMDPHASKYPRMRVNWEGIEGSWESRCEAEFAENGTYQKYLYAFASGRMTKKIVVYRDRNCQFNQTWQRVYSGEYGVVLDELRQQFYNLEVTSQDATQTSLLNLGQDSTDRYCKSVEPFVTMKSINFSPITQCNEETNQVSKLDLRGERGLGRELFVDGIRLERSNRVY